MGKSYTLLVTSGVLLCCGATTTCRADVKMPALFGDHMVLQQDTKISLWGWADAGEEVTVSIGIRSGKAVAGTDGKWRVNLEPLPTQAGPQTLTVTGKNNLKFEDVLIGDVWVCSGQSNMEYDLGSSHTGREDLPHVNDPQIRLFRVPRTDRAEPQADVTARWEVCTPQTARDFSAVAYYFARQVKQSLNNAGSPDNLALGKPVVSSDPNQHSWGNGLTNGVWTGDKNGTFATNHSPIFPKTATIALGQAAMIAQVRLGVPNFGSAKTITVSVSAEGNTFTDVGSYVFSQNKEERHLYTFAPISARYVRLT